MKLKIAAITLFVLFFVSSCKKDVIPAKTTVKVQLDYIGAGGYYNDDIAGVPSGLIVGGTNGPYEIEPEKQYHIQYKASSNFPEVSLDWTPAKGKSYVIHCYVSGNIEHIEANPE